MNFSWIRPARNPIPSSQICELSSSGEQVLIALERQYQSNNARSLTAHQPLPFFGIPQSQAYQGFQMNPENFHGTTRDGRESPETLNRDPNASHTWHYRNHSQSSGLISTVDDLDLSRQSSGLRSAHCVLSLNNQGTYNPMLNINDQKETAYFQELHDVSIANRENFLEQRHVSEFLDSYAATKLHSPKASNVIPSCSSPMSMIDALDVDDTISMSFEDVIESIPRVAAKKDSKTNSIPEGCGCSEIVENDALSCSEVRETAFDYNNHSLDNMSLVSDDESSFLYENKAECTPCKNASYDICSEDLKVEGSKQEGQHKQHSGSDLPDNDATHNISFQRSPGNRKDSSNIGCAGPNLNNFNMEEIFNFRAEDDTTNDIEASKSKLSLSLSFNNSLGLVTSDCQIQKKFLGTPFKRALAASCISNNIYPKEKSFDSALGEPTDKVDINTEDKKQQLKSDNNICKSSISITAAQSLQHTSKSTNNKENALDSKSSLFFPLFKPRSHTKRKADTGYNNLTSSSTGSSVPCKKRIKFKIPYMRKGDGDDTSNCRQIIQLTENLADNIVEKLRLNPPQETTLTILYREGFCQLDRPTTCEIFNPKSILLRILWLNDVQYISVALQEAPWSISFLEKLLSDKTRKICFESQEMIQLLIDKFHFNAITVSSQWLILDPSIGCWLLNPDEPPQSFTHVLEFLNISTENINGAEMLLSKLSQCAEGLYIKLTHDGLWKLFLHIETRITPILACMELRGIQVDVRKLTEMADLLKLRLEAVQKSAYASAGKQFQLTSPQQLGVILYDHLKLDKKHNIFVKETGKRHDKSTSESVLIKFKDLHPLPGIVLEFRRLHKLKSTYVDAVLNHVSGNAIYTTWDQTSASTGRITSNEPNLQAIPKQPLMPDLLLRSAFIAREGYSFLAADFQHIELRVFAHLSKDTCLITALSGETDVFKMLARKWLHLEDAREVSDEDRDKTKRIVYALMYGAGPSKLSEFLHVDYNQANTIFNKFSASFPKMQHFTKTILEKCRKQGYLATETGRRRWFPHINSNNSQMRLQNERQAVNFLIQGTAADLCKSAMVHTQRRLAAAASSQRSASVHLLLQIHDELLWEVPDSHLEHISEVVQEAMEGDSSILQSLSHFSVPLPIVMKVGKTWGEMRVVKNASLGPSQLLRGDGLSKC